MNGSSGHGLRQRVFTPNIRSNANAAPLAKIGPRSKAPPTVTEANPNATMADRRANRRQPPWCRYEGRCRPSCRAPRWGQRPARGTRRRGCLNLVRLWRASQLGMPMSVSASQGSRNRSACKHHMQLFVRMHGTLTFAPPVYPGVSFKSHQHSCVLPRFRSFFSKSTRWSTRCPRLLQLRRVENFAFAGMDTDCKYRAISSAGAAK